MDTSSFDITSLIITFFLYFILTNFVKKCHVKNYILSSNDNWLIILFSFGNSSIV